MRTTTINPLASILILTMLIVLSASLPADDSLAAAVEQAHSDDASTAAGAIETLRAAEQAGVDALRARASSVPKAQRTRFEQALDAVCAQRDCAASGLFWHTDVDAARAAARERGRPILSLRLLGRLDEDRSCANSRFFRTVLYADPRVADLLRAEYVLHWSSERPVPALRIDFGDGRALEGTITGNSAHYVLDAQRRVIDALPGLYGAGLFIERLEDIGRLAERLEGTSDAEFAAIRSKFHTERARRLGEKLSHYLDQTDWIADVQIAGRRALEDLEALAGTLQERMIPGSRARSDRGVPTAGTAASKAFAKLAFERPVISATTWRTPTTTIGDALWQRIASEHPEHWRLSAASRAFLRRKHGPENDPWSTLLVPQAFERSVGIDTARNEYLFHLEIHRWLATEPSAGPSFEDFNASVYSELFLTPASDPWLGLRSADTYLALDASRQTSDRGSDSP